MAMLYHMKLWAVPLVTPIIDEDLDVGTLIKAEVAALRRLEKLSCTGEPWMRLLGNGFYMYGIDKVWTGIIQIGKVGYSPG